MCLFFQKHGFVICKKIIVYLLKFKSKQCFKSKPRKNNDTIIMKFLPHKVKE